MSQQRGITQKNIKNTPFNVKNTLNQTPRSSFSSIKSKQNQMDYIIEKKGQTGTILRKVPQHIFTRELGSIKQQQHSLQKDKYSSIFSQFSSNILNDLMNLQIPKNMVDIKLSPNNKPQLQQMQQSQSQLSIQKKKCDQILIKNDIQQNNEEKKMEQIEFQQDLKYLKEFFHVISRQIIDLFSERLDTETVLRDGNEILLLERVINYGACKENTLFHLKKYLDLCLYSSRESAMSVEQQNNKAIKYSQKQLSQKSRSSISMKPIHVFKSNSDSNQSDKILYQIPREVSHLFMECIEQVINSTENIIKKEQIISIFKERISLLQPITPILEICSTEYFQKLIEIMYNQLLSEPYLNSFIPKKTPRTLILANQLSEFLLTKNYQMIFLIIKRFKEAAIFRDPKEDILLRLEILEQADNNDIQSIKQCIQKYLEEVMSQDHYYEKITQTDFYVIKLLIRRSLEAKGKLADDEVNIFIEAIEETRYFVMPYLYKWAFDEEATMKTVKSMTSKIIAQGSEFLNQYFPQQNVCPIVSQFSKQVISLIITQPNLLELKKLLTLNKKGLVQIDRIKSGNEVPIKNINKMSFQIQQIEDTLELKQQLQFISSISDIVLQAFKQMDYTTITQRDIQIKFLKIGWSFIPKNILMNSLKELTYEFYPSKINLSNIDVIVYLIKMNLKKKHLSCSDLQIEPLCEIGREFLLNFMSIRNTYCSDDLINCFKYYDISSSQINYLYEAIEFALTSAKLWTNSTQQLIQEEFSLI